MHNNKKTKTSNSCEIFAFLLNELSCMSYNFEHQGDKLFGGNKIILPSSCNFEVILRMSTSQVIGKIL